MVAKQVVVEAYNPSWPAEFARIQDVLSAAVGRLVLCIEHVGSTSVPGLAAKPVIDIDVVIKDRSSFEAVRRSLEEIGYAYEGDLGIKDREAFKCLGRPDLMKHHLYVCPQDSQELRRHLSFRDYLRTHPDAAADYARIKAEGARQFPNDIDGYIRHKSSFVQRVYDQLGVSHE